MNIEIKKAEKQLPIERIYIMAGILKSFKGKRDVELQIIRPCAKEEEFFPLFDKNLVDAPDPAMPAALVENSSMRKALGCILEAFTEDEAKALANYLAQRYGDKFSSLFASPMIFPVPFGVAPLAELPESKNSGFIRFERASDYPLPFSAWGYYDLDTHSSISGI